MTALRNPESGCPWDVAQTFASVAPFTVEEAYEVADAIAREDQDELREELGDLLFQVVFHSRMAEEAGDFSFDDVVAGICRKLERRHPHVFGSPAERAAGADSGSWERIKAAERQEKAARRPDGNVDGAGGALAGIATALPALNKAQKLGARAARVGFDWPDVSGVRDKVTEELEELDVAFERASSVDIEEELGDLLFSIANLARHMDVDPEQALQAANRKFYRRFTGMEADARAQGTGLEDLTAAELEQLWEAQKHR